MKLQKNLKGDEASVNFEPPHKGKPLRSVCFDKMKGCFGKKFKQNFGILRKVSFHETHPDMKPVAPFYKIS